MNQSESDMRQYQVIFIDSQRGETNRQWIRAQSLEQARAQAITQAHAWNWKMLTINEVVNA